MRKSKSSRPGSIASPKKKPQSAGQPNTGKSRQWRSAGRTRKKSKFRGAPMADPRAIVERIRALGANVYIDGDRLRIANRSKLPAKAIDVIRDNAAEIAEWLEDEAAYEERAAIIEHDGGLTRAVAEYITK